VSQFGKVHTSAVPASAGSSLLTYEPYYGLREKPFSLSADPRFLYKSPSHAPIFDDLRRGIRRREGLVVLTGDIGTGKTTMCKAVIEDLDRKTFSSFVPDPFVSREDLLKMLLVDFGVTSIEEVKAGRLAGTSRPELSYSLYDFLKSLVPLQAFAVLIIDEAQNLSVPLLEEIRILSDLEAPEKLLQVVLVGQLELQDKLKLPEMRQVDQRVSVRCELQPMSRSVVTGYITHRLDVAGAGSDRVDFSSEAVDEIFRVSKGVPRLVNLICDRALHHGYLERSVRIQPPHVVRATVDLGLRKRPVEIQPDRVEPAKHVTRDAQQIAEAAAVSEIGRIPAPKPLTATPPIAATAPAVAVAPVLPANPTVGPALTPVLAPASAPAARSVPGAMSLPAPVIANPPAPARASAPEPVPVAASMPAVLPVRAGSKIFSFPDSAPLSHLSPAFPLEVPEPVETVEPAETSIETLDDGESSGVGRRWISGRTAAVCALVLASAALITGLSYKRNNAAAAQMLELPPLPPSPKKTLDRSIDSLQMHIAASIAIAEDAALYSIDVAGFNSVSRSTDLVEQLTSAGYKAYFEDRQFSRGRMYLVRVGPYLVQADADADAAKIRAIPGYGDARVSSVLPAPKQ
jgi:type II secretory pathway predicted ATPase ExeA